MVDWYCVVFESEHDNTPMCQQRYHLRSRHLLQYNEYIYIQYRCHTHLPEYTWITFRLRAMNFIHENTSYLQYNVKAETWISVLYKTVIN